MTANGLFLDADRLAPLEPGQGRNPRRPVNVFLGQGLAHDVGADQAKDAVGPRCNLRLVRAGGLELAVSRPVGFDQHRLGDRTRRDGIDRLEVVAEIAGLLEAGNQTHRPRRDRVEGRDRVGGLVYFGDVVVEARDAHRRRDDGAIEGRPHPVEGALFPAGPDHGSQPRVKPQLRHEVHVPAIRAAPISQLSAARITAPRPRLHCREIPPPSPSSRG